MGVMQHLNAAGPEGEQHVVTFMRHMLPRMHRLEGLSDAQIVLGMILNLTACVTEVWTVEEAVCPHHSRLHAAGLAHKVPCQHPMAAV